MKIDETNSRDSAGRIGREGPNRDVACLVVSVVVAAAAAAAVVVAAIDRQSGQVQRIKATDTAS